MRVAAYCRVSTDQDEQLLSYENQVTYYTDYIKKREDYEFAGIYADEGISGTSTKKREEFLRMVADCKAGKIDLIITKSISRFARNTKDCLEYCRVLKDNGTGIFFEKENINTLESQGEVLLTILSSLAQEESRTISENSKWGLQRRMEQGFVLVNTTKFTGYDRDKNGSLVINKKQAKIVERIFKEFMEGKTVDYIAKCFTKEELKNWEDRIYWAPSTIQKILMNEKYKGDALLQKSYTVDYLNKKRVRNDGQVKQYYVHDSHPAIIEPEMWECVQLEMVRRKQYIEAHGLNSYAHLPDKNPFAGKIICAMCGQAYGRRTWRSTTPRRIWQCGLRYRRKGVIGCDNRHVDDEVFTVQFINSYNELVDNREDLKLKWEKQLLDENLLIKFRARQFIEHFEKAKPMEEFEPEIMFKLLDHITVFPSGKIEYIFFDGTVVEWKKE